MELPKEHSVPEQQVLSAPDRELPLTGRGNIQGEPELVAPERQLDQQADDQYTMKESRSYTLPDTKNLAGGEW